MNLNRRELISGTIGLAGAVSLAQICRANPLIGTALPLDMAKDPRRPQYHLLPKANWMNDPNGPIYWNGNYHMFYQYNPNGAYWGDMHWGHAISFDMVHWRHLPVALTPTPGGPDSAGCFSGSAVVHNDRVVMLYTGVVSVPESEATIRDGAHSLRESQCLAIGEDKNLTIWKKDALPVIAAPPAGMDVSGFRDPCPWRNGDTWYMAVGSGIRGKGGAVLLYRSKDLHHWEYLHLLAGGPGNRKSATNPVDSGDMWECPDFFPLGGKHVLIHSTQGKAYWQSGIFDSKRLVFIPERGGVLDYGAFYAPKTQLDRHQNRILWGWIQETRPLKEYRAAGWAGMMSLPRVLTLDHNGELRFHVAQGIEELRQKEQTLHISASEDEDRKQIVRMRIEDCCGEIACAFTRGSEPFELSLISDSGNEHWLRCRYDPLHPENIIIDEKHFPLGAKNDERIELHLYIDGSVIESFVNGEVAYTKRFYYAGSAAPKLGIQVDGTLKNLSGLSMWQILPISPNRLTT